MTRIYRHWGFMPAPPGEYQVSLMPQGQAALEISWGGAKVEAGKVVPVSINSGIELSGEKPNDVPPDDWMVLDSANHAVAHVYQRWGFTPLPAGSYVVQVPHDPNPFTRNIRIEEKVVLKLTLGPNGFPGDIASTGPTDLTIRANPGDTVIEISWNPPAGQSVAGYRVYRTGSVRPINGNELIHEARFTDIGLTNGRTYHYTVRAVLSDGTEWKGFRAADVTIPGD